MTETPEVLEQQELLARAATAAIGDALTFFGIHHTPCAGTALEHAVACHAPNKK